MRNLTNYNDLFILNLIKQVKGNLLRGAVLVSGSMATIITTLFFDSIYGVAVTLFLGAGIIALIDETIVTNFKNNK